MADAIAQAIVRPQPLGEPTTDLERLRNYLGYEVYEGHYLDKSGLLAPATYGRDDMRVFMEAIEALGSNEAIEAWIAANPIG